MVVLLRRPRLRVHEAARLGEDLLARCGLLVEALARVFGGAREHRHARVTVDRVPARRLDGADVLLEACEVVDTRGRAGLLDEELLELGHSLVDPAHDLLELARAEAVVGGLDRHERVALEPGVHLGLAGEELREHQSLLEDGGMPRLVDGGAGREVRARREDAELGGSEPGAGVGRVTAHVVDALVDGLGLVRQDGHRLLVVRAPLLQRELVRVVAVVARRLAALFVLQLGAEDAEGAARLVLLGRGGFARLDVVLGDAAGGSEDSKANNREEGDGLGSHGVTRRT